MEVSFIAEHFAILFFLISSKYLVFTLWKKNCNFSDIAYMHSQARFYLYQCNAERKWLKKVTIKNNRNQHCFQLPIVMESN